MIVLFFKYNFNYVQNYVNTHDNCLALWYSENLKSYKLIENFINIDKLLIEESIYKNFVLNYEELETNFQIELFSSGILSENNNKKISFYASNDTHVYLFKNILNKYAESKYNLFCQIGESGREAGFKLGLKVEEVSPLSRTVIKDTSLMVFGNDWGRYEQYINIKYLLNGINTVCLQESILDFNPRDKRLMNCSFPVFQGLKSLQYIDLNKKIAAVIGNSRFENLTPTKLPEPKKVFINVNFTYGIHEDIRASWINDILVCCKNLNLDYIISQHPRDTADLSAFNLLKSNAGVVHDSIKNSTVVISRFSALIFEAISLGRPAIYYNPHGEKMQYDFEPDHKSLFLVDNAKNLNNVLKYISSNEYTFPEKPAFLTLHLGTTSEGNASEYIFMLLEILKKQKILKIISFLKCLKLIYNYNKSKILKYFI